VYRTGDRSASLRAGPHLGSSSSRAPGVNFSSTFLTGRRCRTLARLRGDRTSRTRAGSAQHGTSRREIIARNSIIRRDDTTGCRVSTTSRLASVSEPGTSSPTVTLRLSACVTKPPTLFTSITGSCLSIAELRTQMRPTVTDRVAWSVSLYVTVVSPAITAHSIEMPFGLRIRVDPESRILDGVEIPMRRDNFDGEMAAHCTLGTLCREL